MNHLEREKYSKNQIKDLKERIVATPELKIDDNLCVYMTGSYARLEACNHSDLDLFFISDGGFSKIEKTLVDAALIRLSREMKICDFSGDGKYLEIHKLEKMTKELGSQSDDYENFFTARLLLLLESLPLINENLYERVINEIIECYFKDYENHIDNFKPTFLINDIIRYWKTITLNYENKRIENPDDGKMRVSNFKLRFSRKLMCFSFIMKLLSKEEPVNKEDVLEIVKQTPIERMKSLKVFEIDDLIEDVLTCYDWFLSKTSVEKSETMTWLEDQKNRNETLEKSEKFGELLFKVLLKVDRNDYLKYLVI